MEVGKQGGVGLESGRGVFPLKDLFQVQLVYLSPRMDSLVALGWEGEEKAPLPS